MTFTGTVTTRYVNGVVDGVVVASAIQGPKGSFPLLLRRVGVTSVGAIPVPAARATGAVPTNAGPQPGQRVLKL